MSSRLALHFLGPPEIDLNDEPLPLERRKALALLAYLAVEQGGHSRESLSALLWPDYAQSIAFKNLRQVLWELQKILGEGWLTSESGKVRLRDGGRVWLDVHEFESRFAEGCAQNDLSGRIALLADSAKLYRNHFLTGFSLKDAFPFNDWAFDRSEELRQKLSVLLAKLSEDYCALGQAAQAIPHARRFVSLDPLNESAHRQLMEVYLQAGQQSAALKQYQELEQILRKELNLDPQPETRELYKKIRKGRAKPVAIDKQVETANPQSNLPHQLSTFIGREKEQEEITKLLSKKRLVTLLGAGGIGKTRLAVQMGQKLLDSYPDGVWFIPLAALSEPARTTQTVASIFDIQEDKQRSLLDKLMDFLRAKTALLIFDNCEHLLDACADLLPPLLTSCPNIQILATSRESLSLPGEARYTIPSLPLPEQNLKSVEQVGEFESIQLFAERAALVLPSFQLTKENVQTVVEICRKVDGIPLGIELAAARVNMLQVSEILGQLQNSFALLSSDIRTLLPRHKTLRASMDWSWRLLDEEEQTFLRQLSVFAGGWTLEAAQAVCDGDALSLSAALAKKSLLVVDQHSGRETRYHFHEIVREFAREKLLQSGTEGKIRTRHLAYFMNVAKQAELELRGPTRVVWIDRVHDEHNNLRGALHWAEQTDVEAGLFLAGRLMRYWESADLREGIQWLEAFLHKSESKEFPLARATALLTYGWLLTWLQQFSLARTVTEESLGLFRATGDPQGEIDSLISLANIDQFLDNLDSGTALLHQALALAQVLGDTWREAVALGFLGWDRRDVQQAFKYWEKAIQLYREVGDQISLANLLSLLAQFRILNGDIEIGEKHLEESILLWQSNEKANVWEHPKLVKSLILVLRGEYEQAYSLLQDALMSAQETGNRMSQLWLRVRLGYVALRAGNLVEAHDLLAETLQDFHNDGYTIGAIFALEGIATLLIATGKPEKAARLIGCADATRERIPDRRPVIEEADMYRNMAAILSKIGPTTFEVVYDEGRSMTMDEAVAYALQGN